MQHIKSNYKILQNKDLIIEYHEGILELNPYKTFKVKIFDDPLYTNSLNYIVNFKNVNFKMTPDDIEEYCNYLKQIPKILGKKKIAFITRTPNQIVPATIYKMKQNELGNQTVDIFSTYESALNWLQSDITPNELDLVFNELKK